MSRDAECTHITDSYTEYMHITFILDDFGGGGKERRCLQLIQGLNREGYNDIQVILLKNLVQYPELYQTTSQLHIIDRKAQHISVVVAAKMIHALLQDFKPDIVQAWGKVSAACALLNKPFMKFKFICSYVADCDKPPFWRSKFYVNMLCKRMCDKVVGNSAKGLKVYGIPSKKAVLIYNGINEKRQEFVIDVNWKKKEMNITTPFVVAMIAVFRKDKDWDCFLDTAKAIIKQRSDITFLAVGSGDMWEKYNNSVTEEYRPLLKILGRREDTDEILQICDLTVLSSHHGEGISNSIMESMAFGVPVIATNSGGTPEIISDGIDGVLMPRNDVEWLRKMINNLIDNQEMRIELGVAAKKKIKEHFTLSRMTRNYIDLYTSLLNK